MRNSPSEKGKAIAGTTIIYLCVLAVLFLVAFSVKPPPEQEEGILVNFGTEETGLGLIEPSPAPASEETSAATQPATETPSDEPAVTTQDFDKEAPEVKKVDPEAEIKKKELQEAAEKKRLADIEAERIRKEQETERQRIAEEERRVAEIANRTKNALANAKNTGTVTTGEGITGGPGNQGDTRGSVDSQVRGAGSGTGDEGISYDLAGRKFQTLPAPKYDYQGEGRVVVEIIVDRNGNVIQAEPGKKGSTTLDEYLLKVAKEAALKAIFESKSDGPDRQIGTITYIFKLR